MADVKPPRICKAHELPEGASFVTRITRRTGVVLELRPTHVDVLLSKPGVDGDEDFCIERRMHRDVLVERA